MLMRFILFLCLTFWTTYSLAEEEFLPPEQAFAIQPSKVISSDQGNHVEVSWKIADGYYMYRNKVSFTPKDDSLKLGEIELSESETKNDPYFGEIQVFKKSLTAKVPFSSDKEKNELLEMTAKTQGCASGGICYPPLKQIVSFQQPGVPVKAPLKTTSVKSVQTNTPNNLTAPQANSTLAQLANIGGGIDAQDDFLDVEQAFKFSISALPQKKQLSAIWSIADAHYLYKNKFKFELIEGNGFVISQPEMPDGKPKSDEYLGDYEAYYHDLVLNIPVSGKGDSSKPLAIKVTYQGCSESGICYPKVSKNVELDMTGFSATPVAAAAASSIIPTKKPLTGNDPLTKKVIESEQDALAGLLSSDNTFWLY